MNTLLTPPENDSSLRNSSKNKILYLTNIEVPYRVRFFNELAKQCDLTVLYERRKSANRNAAWSNAEEKNYKTIFLDGTPIGNEYSFSLRIVKLVRQSYDAVIVGCYNSKSQIIAMQAMRLWGIPYIINLDGEPYIGQGIKATIKKLMLKGASAYIVAGNHAAESLQTAIKTNVPVRAYGFSSLSEQEVSEHATEAQNITRNNTVLVVGQYYDYKGMDIALEAARKDSSIPYTFVGMGSRTDLFLQEQGDIPDNVTVIPFLQKKDLETLYKQCAILVLPSRQECWGLVINEAASFGMPIVSTDGSGAAVEYLSEKYHHFLAAANDADSLLSCIHTCLGTDNKGYSEYLVEKSRKYTIENCVEAHIKLLEEILL